MLDTIHKVKLKQGNTMNFDKYITMLIMLVLVICSGCDGRTKRIAVPTPPSDVAIKATNDDKVIISTTSTTTNTISTTVVNNTQAPLITSLSPSTGPVGATVTIFGSNLSGGTQVMFGLVLVPTISVTDNQVTVMAPPGVGTVFVTVTTTQGTSNELPFTYSTLAITSLTPTIGSAGTAVTITGSALDGATGVEFGSTAVVPISVTSTQVVAIAPAAPTDSPTVAVSVVTPVGTSNSLPFTYQPVIVSLSPSGGTGGTVVTIEGNSFLGATQVNWGSTVIPASSFVSQTNTQIQVAAPVGSGTASVTVTTPAGESNSLTFSYVA